MTASDTARLTGISARSINKLYLKLRIRLAQLCEHNAHLSSIVEMDESYYGIESFWSYAKGRLAKFKDVAKHTFYLHLKETEFRFNHRHENMYKTLLKILRKTPYRDFAS